MNSMVSDSRMMEVEPSLVNLIIKMSQIRRCLSPTQYLNSTKDLIYGTKTEKKYLKHVCFSRTRAPMLEKLQTKMETQVIWKKGTKVCS